MAEAAHEDARLAQIERTHIERLRTAIRALGDDPPVIAAVSEDDPETAEERTIAVLQGLLPRLSDPELRGLLADMMVVDAQQLAVLRLQAGADAAPGAFLSPGMPS
jgi:hypothetical protein